MAGTTRPPAAREYTATLEAFLASAGEFALERAYEIGRHAAHEGMSLLQFAELHHRALRTLTALPGAHVEEVLTRGEQFFAEGLSAFELILRGHRASARLLGLSDGLRRQNGELGRARTQLKAVLDATQALVYLRDADGHLLFVNGGFERLFGVKEARVLGKTARDLARSLQPPGHSTPVHAPLVLLLRSDAAVLTAPGPLESECSWLLADGPHVFRVIDVPLFDHEAGDHEAGDHEAGGEEPEQGAYAVCTIAADVTREHPAEQLWSLARDATEAAQSLSSSAER